MGRFLLETQATSTLSATDANPTTLRDSSNNNNCVATMDTNMVIILAALLCGLICALSLHSVLRCIVRYTRRSTTLNEDPIDTNVNMSNNGIKNIQALKRIPIDSYNLELKMKATECLICLGEFVEGENVRVLPKCNHGFHVKCIDTWLISHSSCPTCRQSLLEYLTHEADCSRRDDDVLVAT